MMSTELTPQQSFQSKMEERIRKDIGELMPDDALADIVTKAIEKAFFQSEIIPGGPYNRDTTEPPWMVRITKELVDTRVQSAVKHWIVLNEDKVMKMISEKFDEGIAGASVKAFDSIFQNQLYDLQQRIETSIQNLRVG